MNTQYKQEPKFTKGYIIRNLTAVVVGSVGACLLFKDGMPSIILGIGLVLVAFVLIEHDLTKG